MIDNLTVRVFNQSYANRNSQGFIYPTGLVKVGRTYTCIEPFRASMMEFITDEEVKNFCYWVFDFNNLSTLYLQGNLFGIPVSSLIGNYLAVAATRGIFSLEEVQSFLVIGEI